MERQQPSLLPKCILDKEQVDSIQQKLGIPLLDLHIYKNDYSLCVLLDELEASLVPSPFSFRYFFHDLIEEQLYWLGYFEKNGEEPWSGYSHGPKAYIEAFLDRKMDRFQFQKIIETRSKLKWKDVIALNRNSRCLCGSGDLVRNCHGELLAIAGEVRRLSKR